MLYGDEELFSLVRSAKLGHIELPPVLALLRDWIHSEFGVSVVHIVLDHVKLGPSTGRPRLNVILETDYDYDSWKSDVITIRPEIERRVLSQFNEFAQTDPQRYDTDETRIRTLDPCFIRGCNFCCQGRRPPPSLPKHAQRLSGDTRNSPLAFIRVY